jgi:serine phosphatase RsbU (regulator of sigma subunit)
MGGEQPIRFSIGVVVGGLFAVAYAFGGISLRSKFWMAIIPLMALQSLVMTMVANLFPDPPRSAQPTFAEREHMHGRLTFDAVAIIVAMALGYTGFVIVFVSEGRRHIRVHTEKAILDGEMAAAREVQMVMLPESGGSIPGYSLESLYRPADQVGGDFFQILPAGNGGLLIVLGDVAGKGLPAAMLVSMLVGSIRILAEDTHDPVQILQKLNERLTGRTRGGFSTALAAFLAKDGRATIANAGHLSPYLNGREIELQGALPLGIVSGVQYVSSSFEFPPGSRLTFISDGVVEAQNQSGELFGFARAEAMSREPAAAILKAAADFGQSDDITVVTIERQATSEAASAA